MISDRKAPVTQAKRSSLFHCPRPPLSNPFACFPETNGAPDCPRFTALCRVHRSPRRRAPALAIVKMRPGGPPPHTHTLRVGHVSTQHRFAHTSGGLGSRIGEAQTRPNPPNPHTRGQ